MISTFYSLFSTHFSSTPFIPEVLTPSINFNMDPFCEGCVPYNNSDICPLSGRVTVSSEMVTSESLHSFLHHEQPEMSVNLNDIQHLAESVLVGNYPAMLLEKPELPNTALGALVGGILNMDEVAQLLLWHQEKKDYPLNNFQIIPLFDANDKLANAAQELWNTLTPQQLKILHTALKTLPASQQVIRTMNSNKLHFLEPIDLPSQALRIFVHIKTGHQAISWKPRLGNFLKEDIVKEEIKSKNRLRYIPFPGVPAKLTMNGVPYKHSEFSAHDLYHLELMNGFTPAFIDSLREIMLVVRETTKNIISDEIWEIGDFAFTDDLYMDAPQIAFNKFIEEISNLFSESDLFHWIIILHMRTHNERWKSKYDISADQISHSTYQKKIDLADDAKKYLLNRPILEKVYLLQELEKSGMKASDFFPKKLLEPIPLLVVRRVNGIGEKGTLELKVIAD